MKEPSSLGRYLLKKSNFMTYWILSVGVPGGIGLVWWYGAYGGIGFWIFLLFLAFCGAYVSGQAMWLFFADARKRITDLKEEDEVSSKQG